MSDNEFCEVQRVIKHYEKMDYHSILFTDCDGVLTDACVYYSDSGYRMRKFNVRDGHAFSMLRDAGIMPIVISGEYDTNQRRRFEKIGIIFIGGIVDKAKLAKRIIADTYVNKTFFIGDDIMDIPLLGMVDVGGCPRDAHRDVLAMSPEIYVSGFNGGEGAFRDFCEEVLGIISR